MPDFQNPLAFLLLLIIPLLYILRKLKIFSRISFPVVLSDWGGESFEWNGKAQIILSRIAKGFVIAGFVFTVFSLSEPVLSHQEKVFTSLSTLSPPLRTIILSGEISGAIKGIQR